MSKENASAVRKNIREIVQAGQWPGVLFSATVLGLYEALVTVSLVSLIFSGPLEPYLPVGIGLGLMAAAVLFVCVALFSSVPGILTSTQESTTVLLALITATLAQTLPPESMLSSVLVALALSILLTGLVLFILGVFRIGFLTRYIPYPVIGGFMAGTGWLLVVGTFTTLTDLPFNLPNLFQPEFLILWLPSALLALAVFLVSRRINHPLVLPVALVGSIVLFYLVLLLSGTSIEQASAIGLLSGGDFSVTWQPLSLSSLVKADWQAILGQGGNIAALIGITLVGLLLNLSGLELSIHREFNINQELRVTGIALLATGLVGGIIGYHGLGTTRLGYQMGGKSRYTGVVAALVCLAILLLGTLVIGYFPKPVIGMLLFLLGFEFLYEWVFTGWKRFTRVEYGIVLLILAVIALVDFLAGIVVGLVAMVIMFVFSYSRTTSVHHEFDGTDVHSSVERSSEQRKLLGELGSQIYVLELIGFIFFGTANAIVEMIKKRVEDPALPPVRFIVLDFRLVSGIDSSAALSFSKCQKLLEAQEIHLVLTHVSKPMRQTLHLGGVDLGSQFFELYQDLDHGLESCENRVLTRSEDAPLETATLHERLVQDGFPGSMSSRLDRYLEPRLHQPGDYLIHQDEAPEHLYYIVEGRISVYLEGEGEEKIRLNSLADGTFVGEMGLYMNTSRTASVIAIEPTRSFYLSRQKLDQMQQEDPALAAAFHQLIARQLSERLAQANRAIRALRV